MATTMRPAMRLMTSPTPIGRAPPLGFGTSERVACDTGSPPMSPEMTLRINAVKDAANGGCVCHAKRTCSGA